MFVSRVAAHFDGVRAVGASEDSVRHGSSCGMSEIARQLAPRGTSTSFACREFSEAVLGLILVVELQKGSEDGFKFCYLLYTGRAPAQFHVNICMDMIELVTVRFVMHIPK